MFRLRAPYPAMTTTILLPSPLFGDNRSLRVSINRMRAMDGTLYTYVKKKGGTKQFSWRFELSRDKALEMEAFLKVFFDGKVQVVDHNDESWVGYIRNNPFELNTVGRAKGWPGGESMNIEIQFEEV